MVAIEEVAQIAKTASGTDGPVESLKHKAIGCLIEAKLYVERRCSLHSYCVGAVRHYNHHSVTIHVAHCTIYRLCPLFVFVARLFSKDDIYRSSELEIVFNLIVLCSQYFHRELV